MFLAFSLLVLFIDFISDEKSNNHLPAHTSHFFHSVANAPYPLKKIHTFICRVMQHNEKNGLARVDE